MIEFKMPSLGADMEDGTLTEWRIKVGDLVKRGDIIAEVETQKGLIEIEIFEEGIVKQLLVNVGDKVKVGNTIALIGSADEQVTLLQTKITEAYAKPAETEELKETPKKEVPEINTQHARVKISPLAKKMAIENHINFASLSGTGDDGAITKEDIEKAIAGKAEEHKTAYSTNSIRKAVAAAMSKSKREIPHYYLETKIDMSCALQMLAELNKNRSSKDRLLPVVLLLKATALALHDIPQLNGTWENELIMKEKINIGFVVSLKNGGVMIPAIHDADKKSLDEMMISLSDLIIRSRSLKLRSSELSDSTVSVTSLGDHSADTVFGVIYPPQVAIIGFGNIREQAWAENGKVEAKQIISVTLSADHRATDGHTGSRFLSVLNNYLQNPEKL